MKKGLLFLLASVMAVGYMNEGGASIIRIDTPNIAIINRQPVEVIIVDRNGNIYRQIAYYDPAFGGLDIDISWAGPNASIYIPVFGVRYIWYNGYWVNESGYYWDGTRRVYVDYPNWNAYWTRYWMTHDRVSHWRDDGLRRHDRFDGDIDRRGDWQRDDRFDERRRINRHGDWRGRDLDGRRLGDAVRSREFEGQPAIRAGNIDGVQPGSRIRSRRFEGQPGRAVRSGEFEGQPAIRAGNVEGTQPGRAVRSGRFEGQPAIRAGNVEGAQSGGTIPSGGVEGQSEGTMRSSNIGGGRSGNIR